MQKVSFALLSLVAVGCGPYLQYKSQPAAPSPAGKIIVEVRDSREPKVGGDKKELVGLQTGAFGIPTAIKVGSPTTVSETMQKLVGEAAMSAGVGVAGKGEEAGATARVIVDVQRFWCTGYNPVYKGDVTASVMITDPNGQQIRVPGQPMHGEDGGMNCQSIYRKALTNFFNNTKAMLSMDNVKAAATGANTQAAPPPAQ
jgi:hypothetical protein